MWTGRVARIGGADLCAPAGWIGPNGGSGGRAGRRPGAGQPAVHGYTPDVQRDTPATSARHAGLAGAFAYSLEQMLEPGHLLGHNEEPDRQQLWLSPLLAGAEVVGEDAPRPLAGRSRDRTWCAARSLRAPGAGPAHRVGCRGRPRRAGDPAVG